MSKQWKQFLTLYQENYLTIRDHYKRSLIVSRMLIIIQESEFLSITLNQLKPYPFPMQKVAYCRYFPTDLSVNIYIQLVMFIFMVSFFGLVIVLHFKFNREDKEETSISKYKNIQHITLTMSEINLINQMKQNNYSDDLRTRSFVVHLISVFIQTWEYIGSQILLMSSLVCISQTLSSESSSFEIFGFFLSLFTLPIQLTLSIFLNVHRFSFSFRTQDFLGNNYTVQFDSFLRIIIIFSCQFKINYYIKISLLIVFYSYLVICGNRFKFYQNIQTQCFSTLLHGELLGILILLTLPQNLQEAGLYYLLICPLILEIQIKLFEFKKKSVCTFQNLKEYNEEQLDLSIRYMYQQAQNIFVKKQDIFNNKKSKTYYSLQIFNFVANHLRQCNESKCFCLEFFPQNEIGNSKSWKRFTEQDDEAITEVSQGFQSEKQFKLFIVELIKHTFDRFIEERQTVDISIWLSYIYFLTEVVKRPTKAFSQALTLNVNPQYKSLRNTMIIEALVKTARRNFNMMILKKDLKNQKYNFQIAFSYDKSIQIVKSNILKTTRQLKSWYNLMIYDRNNVYQIKNEGYKLLQQIDLIQQQLDLLFQANPLSTEIENLYHIYFKYLNYYQKRNKNFRKSSKLTNTYLNSAQKEVFNKDSCVIYITLLNPIGTVLKFTRNFPLITGFKDVDIQEQNIKNFMPDVLAYYHDMYLQNFVEKGRMNIVMTEHRFLLVKTKAGFIIPVVAKIRLENYSTQDFGASALISRVNTQHNYVLLNQYGRLEEINENMYNQLYKYLKFSIKQMRGLDFLLLMPQLWKVWRQNAVEEEQDQNEDNLLVNRQIINDNLLVLPTLQKSITQLQQNRQAGQLKLKKYFDKHKEKMIYYFNQLDDIILYNVKYKIIEIKTINQISYILEIQSFKHIKKTSNSEKLTKVNQIINQLFPDRKQINLTHEFTNIQPSLIIEEQEMSEMLNQNLAKVSQMQLQRSVPKSFNTSSDHLRPIDNQILQAPLSMDEHSIIKIIEEKIPSFHIHSKDFTSESEESLSEQNFKLEIDDKSSVASAQAQQHQLTKKNLIKQVLLGKQRSSNLVRLAVFLGLMGLFIISLVFYFFLFANVNSIKESVKMDHNVLRIDLLLNAYIIYHKDNKIVSQINQHMNVELKNYFDYILKLKENQQIFSKQLNRDVDILYALNDLNEQMMKFQFDYSQDNLVFINYWEYEKSFTLIYKEIHKLSNEYMDQQKATIYNIFILGLVYAIIFALTIIPMTLLVDRKISKIIQLLYTFDYQDLQKQYIILQSVIDVSEQQRFTIEEVTEIFVDQSKNRQLISLTKTQDSRPKVQKLQKRAIPSKNYHFMIKIYFITLFIIGILQAYFAGSYILWSDQNEYSKDYIQNLERQIFLNQGISKILAEMSLFKIFQFDNSNVMQYFIDSMIEQGPNYMNASSYWQSYLEQASNQIPIIKDAAQVDSCQYLSIWPYISDQKAINYHQYSGFNGTQCRSESGSVILITNLLNSYQQQRTQLESSRLVVLNQDEELLTSSIYLQAGLYYLYFYLLNFEIDEKIEKFIILHSIILAINIIVLFIGFYLGIKNLSIYVQSLMNQSKQLLSLLPLDTLAENSYVMSFMIQEQGNQNF